MGGDLHTVGARVLPGDFNRHRIDVHRIDAPGAELCRGNRQDAGAAAVIEHVFAAAHYALEKAQHETRGRMTARAEREAGIHADDECVARRLVPARANP